MTTTQDRTDSHGDSDSSATAETPEASTTGARRTRLLTWIRWGALTVWLVVSIVLMRLRGVPEDRSLLLLFICSGLAAASIGHGRTLAVIRDWLPFALILFVYDKTRDAALWVGRPTSWLWQPKVDRWLFFGHEPTIWLQQHLKAPSPSWWEVIVSSVYMSFFFIPYITAGILWLRNRDLWREFVIRFVALSFISLIGFVLVPAAPPWAASKCSAAQVVGGPSYPPCMAAAEGTDTSGGVLGSIAPNLNGANDFIERISTRGWGELHLEVASTIIDKGQSVGNLVAAIPSLHAGLTGMVAVFLWTRVRRRWRPLLVAYPLAMAFALVFTAEHYVIDILIGWTVAALVLVACSACENWWAARRQQPVEERIPEPARS